MIDQTKEKKDEGFKIEKAEAKKEDPNKALEQAQLTKLEAKQDKEETQPQKAPVPNSVQAMQALGSAKIESEDAELSTEPEREGGRLGILPKGSKIEVLARQANSLKILHEGKVAYVQADKTDFQAGTQTAHAPKVKGTVHIQTAALNVRKGPSDAHAILGVLKQGDHVKYYGEKDGYLELQIGGQRGFIRAEYTDLAKKTVRDSKADEKASEAFDQAPEALRLLLAKETLDAAELAQARSLIETSPEDKRAEFFEALQRKPAYAKLAKEKQKQGQRDEHAGNLEQLAMAFEMLGIRNPNSELPFATTLEQIKREQKLPSDSGLQAWGAIANAMGASYSMLCQTGNRQGLEKAFWMSLAKEQLRQGRAVMASIQHQAVRVEGIDDKGLIITLPEGTDFTGLGAGWSDYDGKCTQKTPGKRGILAFEALPAASLQWVISMA